MEHVNDIDDRWAMAIGIPGFGLTIPHLVGLMGPLTAQQPLYWLGTVLFVALAWAIWSGNRWLLFRQRERLDWFTRPVPKIVFLIVGCVLYTAPLTAGTISGWYVLAGQPIDTDALRAVVLMNVICVLVVTHLYETAFLVKARRGDRLALAEAAAERARAELAALQSQVDPHFLFNSLGTLAWLIEEDPAAGAAFARRLADTYRYLLAHRDRDLVLLEDELAFFDDCLELLQARFRGGLRVHRQLPDQLDRYLVPPIALQTLLENAVKHNRFSERDPLELHLHLAGETLAVRNPRRPKAADGLGLGLENLRRRCRHVLGRELVVHSEGEQFEVRLPVARMGA